MPFRVRTLSPKDPPDAFPDPKQTGIALGQPDGLLAIGGDLCSERLIAAYSMGIFPWFNEDQPILWWCPDPRAVIFCDQFHMSRSLARELRRGHWSYSLNTCFEEVITRCATERDEYGTWITEDMQEAYIRLHHEGYAHSVESWHDGQLVGGIYGIRLGRAFFGESMFSSRTSGSKVALSGLVQICRDNGITFIDAQLESAHLLTLGMQTLTRPEFLRLLHEAVTDTGTHRGWHQPEQPAKPLSELRSPKN